MPPSRPGDLLAADPLPAPAGTQAWRITYTSTGADGAPTMVTGLVLAPDGPPPPGGRPVITYGHATTGTADICAPSTQSGTSSLPFPEEVAGQGWVIAATDYEGLGGPGAHPYLVGASEGQAMLDAARAATRLPATGAEATSPVVLWGFSQGGHAAGFAALLASRYAPELDLRGLALAAPVSDVGSFAARAERLDDQFGVLVVIAHGLSLAYPELDLTTIFSPAVLADLGVLEDRCISEANDDLNRLRVGGLLRSPRTDPAFLARFAQNSLGDTPVDLPVLVTQGDADTIVEPTDTQTLAYRWCRAGVTVRYAPVPGAGHGIMTPEPFLSWTAARLRGEEPPSTC
jgi:alpha-beta hydrolase superfamily lysophospholipase